MAVVVPVNEGLANGARNAESVVVALPLHDVNTFVVPFIKLPETAKSVAVHNPVNVGLAKGAFKLNCVVVALLFNSVSIFV